MSDGSPPSTDVARADAFLNEYGERIRHTPQLGKGGKWFVWDGKRWAPDDMNQLGSMSRRSGLSASDRGQDAFVRQLTKESSVLVSVDQWDADPWLLACENVTVNLKDGTVRAPDPLDLNTKLAEVSYRGDAECPLWDAFMLRIMDGNKYKVGYLRRLLGYAITGHATEAVLPFLIGDGANGKSTLLRVIQRMMGDYATTASEGLLLASSFQGHPTSLASLMGRRLVIASEMPPGKKLDVARVKQLTGGDVVTARFMYGNEFTFAPTHTLVVQCNHLPRMGDATSSVWRRVQRIDFPVSIPEHERDTALDEKLLAESAGILNWLMAGAKEWAEDGLRVPPEVSEATEEYRQEDDVNAEFFDECAVFVAGGKVKGSDLRQSYDKWADGRVAYGDRWGIHDLAAQAKVRGAVKARWEHGKVRGWKGMALLEAAKVDPSPGFG